MMRINKRRLAQFFNQQAHHFESFVNGCIYLSVRFVSNIIECYEAVRVKVLNEVPA